MLAIEEHTLKLTARCAIGVDVPFLEVGRRDAYDSDLRTSRRPSSVNFTLTPRLQSTVSHRRATA